MPQAVWRVAHVGLAITNPTKEKSIDFSLDSCWLNNSQQLLAASRRSSCSNNDWVTLKSKKIVLIYLFVCDVVTQSLLVPAAAVIAVSLRVGLLLTKLAARDSCCGSC